MPSYVIETKVRCFSTNKTNLAVMDNQGATHFCFKCLCYYCEHEGIPSQAVPGYKTDKLTLNSEMIETQTVRNNH